MQKSFLDLIKDNNSKIIVSTIILKELKYKLDKNFSLVVNSFKNDNSIKLIKTVKEDYKFARHLEDKYDYYLGFYDFLHIAICKRLKIILVTRDRDLIKIASKYIQVIKPEYLI